MHTNKLAVLEGVRSELCRFYTPKGIWTVAWKASPTGAEYLQAVKIPWTALKADLKPIMQEMANMNFSQKAIATFTGVSPSYISKLLRQPKGG